MKKIILLLVADAILIILSFVLYYRGRDSIDTMFMVPLLLAVPITLALAVLILLALVKRIRR